MKQLTGIVISLKMEKTAKIQVLRRWPHPIYHKTLTKKKNYLTHCLLKDLKVGDKVLIQECRPISKLKKWKVVKKV